MDSSNAVCLHVMSWELLRPLSAPHFRVHSSIRLEVITDVSHNQDIMKIIQGAISVIVVAICGASIGANCFMVSPAPRNITETGDKGVIRKR